jgi:hypothetical protein
MGCHKEPDSAEALASAESEHQLEHGRIGSKPLAMLHGRDEARRGEELEALVDAHIKLRRNERTLNGAKLHAFDLPRDRAQLTGGIDLGLDAATGILGNRSGIALANWCNESFRVGKVSFMR